MGKCHSCCRELRHLDSCQDGHELIYYDAGEHEAFSYCPLCEVLARIEAGLNQMERDRKSFQRLEEKSAELAVPMSSSSKEEPTYTRAEVERAILVGLGVSAIMHEEALGEFVMTPGMRQQAIVAFDSGWGKES